MTPILMHGPASASPGRRRGLAALAACGGQGCDTAGEQTEAAIDATDVQVDSATGTATATDAAGSATEATMTTGQ